MSDIIDKINNLEKKINSLEIKIDLILEKLDSTIIDNCNKMGNHIDFIENVYEKVKYPLEYVTNKLTYKKETLPEITE